MPLFPPSVDSGLLGKRPIRGSVAHLPSAHTLTQWSRQTHKHAHSYIITFPHFLFLLLLLSSSLPQTHTHTPFSHSPFLQKPPWFSCTVPAVCWDDSSVSVGEVSVCSGCSAWAPVRPMAAPLGRHTARCCRGALLPWLCCRGTVAKSTSSSGSM